MLCSCAGSTRASIAVLSQIEPTPGAVIAAHAVPEDCDGWPSPENLLPQQIRAGQCLGLVDHGHVGADPGIPERRQRLLHRHVGRAIRLVLGCPRRVGAGGGLAAGALSRPDRAAAVAASTLSWLQSSSRSSMSASASEAAVSAAASASSSGGSAWACAGGAMPTPAASNSSIARPYRVLEIMTPPACRRIDAGTSAQNCGGFR